MQEYSFSAKGSRENNEDCILSRHLSDYCSIHIVADGMGGYSFGEIASQLACEAILNTINSKVGKVDARSLINQAVTDANAVINEKRKELDEKMGTTIAGAFIENHTSYLFWLGDVRIYLFRNNEILFQSIDHSLINEMKQNGHVSAHDIARYKNIVTRHISGSSQELDAPIVEVRLLLGDTLLICSDGMWQNWNISSVFTLSEDELNRAFCKKESSNDDNFTILRLQL